MQKLLTFASMLLVGGIIGFFIGQATGKSTHTSATAPVQELAENLPLDSPKVPAQAESTESTPPIEKESPDASVENSEPPTASVAPVPVQAPKPKKGETVGGDGYGAEDAPIAKATPVKRPTVSPKTTAPVVPVSAPVSTDCITSEQEWSFHLSLFAEELEKQKIAYAQNPSSELRDCSGIFFRMAQFAQSKCENYIYPDPTKTRSSRDLARWYHDMGNLNLVQDPMKSRNLISSRICDVFWTVREDLLRRQY